MPAITRAMIRATALIATRTTPIMGEAITRGMITIMAPVSTPPTAPVPMARPMAREAGASAAAVADVAGVVVAAPMVRARTLHPVARPPVRVVASPTVGAR